MSTASSADAALRLQPAGVDLTRPRLVPDRDDDVATREDADDGGRDRRNVGQLAASGLLAAVIAIVVVVAVLAGARRVGSLTALEVGAIAALSFLPGWLYVRFYGQRAGALWDEYVLNLHRLGLDEPQHLPPPPTNSVYHTRWSTAGGDAMAGYPNIYRQKFEAFYGRNSSQADLDASVRCGTLFPVALATMAFAAGWTGVFWNDALLSARPVSTADMLVYGFLGAYLFDLQMLSRRYFQSDLKPSAYTSAVVRIALVLVTVAVLHQLPLFTSDSGRQEAIVAFVVGLFPIVGLQSLSRLVAVTLRSAVPSLKSNYPLSDLDGLNVWYEARLLEEGIEDMQNLLSANTVEVLLHTRVPVGRLIDWYDQAALYVHLSPRQSGPLARRRERKTGRLHPRSALAEFGIRSATSLVERFPPADLDEHGTPRDALAARVLDRIAARADGMPTEAILTIAGILDADPGLDMVKTWRHWRAACGLGAQSRRRAATNRKAPRSPATIGAVGGG